MSHCNLKNSLESLLRAILPCIRHIGCTAIIFFFFFLVYPPNYNPAFGLGHFPSFPHRFLIETDRFITNIEASKERTKQDTKRAAAEKGFLSWDTTGRERKESELSSQRWRAPVRERDERIPTAQQNSDFLTKQGCDDVQKKHKGSWFTVSKP